MSSFFTACLIRMQKFVWYKSCSTVSYSLTPPPKKNKLCNIWQTVLTHSKFTAFEICLFQINSSNSYNNIILDEIRLIIYMVKLTFIRNVNKTYYYGCYLYHRGSLGVPDGTYCKVKKHFWLTDFFAKGKGKNNI